MSNKYANILKYFITLFLLLIAIKPIKNENNILLDNIIQIGDINFRYINFASYSNGDMIVETTAFPGDDKRMFYAIKLNGRPFFNSGPGTEETYHYSIKAVGQIDNENARYEAIIFIATMNEDPDKGKEYLASITRFGQYAELFDFDRNKMHQKKTSDVLGDIMTNTGGSSVNFKADGKNYIVLAFKDDNNVYYKKVLFNKKEFTLTNPVVSSTSQLFKVGQSVSCFITDLNKIICSFLKIDEFFFSRTYSFYITALDLTLTEIKSTTIGSDIYPDENSFTKCIHLKNEIGVFAYYFYMNNCIVYYCTTLYYPILYFKQLSSDFEDFIPFIELKKYANTDPAIFFNNYLLKNDLIKISDNKLCFITSSSNNETLYIVSINIFQSNRATIRYYSYDLFRLNTFKILLDMKAHLYKKFIALAFSYCPNSNDCTNDATGEHYSAFLLFSYPNGTDFELNINNYLFENNKIKINNIIVDIKQNAKLENDIFGNIYYGYTIKENGCNNINLFSDKTNIAININETIEDENIILKLEDRTIYNKTNCTIKFAYVYTDPNFGDYQNYTNAYDNTYGSFDKDNYNSQKDKYEGKTIYYNILIDEELYTECENNCELCLKRENICITCIYNYTITENESTKNKICLNEKETDIPTEQMTEIITQTEKAFESTEVATEKQTEELVQTEKAIESTEVATEKQTEELVQTEKPIESTELATENQTEELVQTEKPIESTELATEKQTEILTKTDIQTEKEEIEVMEESYKTCKSQDILDGKCIDGIMKNEQIEEIFNQFKENILNENYNKNNTIIKTENVALQISTLEDQKKSLDPTISTIDLGECENILKDNNHIPREVPLIILKTDIKSEDLSSTYVQYEIYNPYNYSKLDLNDCKEVKIVVNVPVNLDSNTLSVYDSLSESGYNLFDSEDDFYNDICSTYTSANGTDMTLEDRKKEIYSASGNITMCQTGCIFESYNKTTKKAKCNCDIQNGPTETNTANINFQKDNSIGRSFLTTLKNSNFLVMKCFKLVFDFSNFFKNKGRIIMTVILFLFLILLLIYIIKDRKKLNVFIQSIIKKKMNDNKKNNNQLKEKMKNNNNKKNKIPLVNNNKEKINKGSNKNSKKIKNNKNNKKKNNLKEPPKKNLN